MGYPAIDIPKEFYSTETNAPIDTCIDCERYLLVEGAEYVIEKAIRHYSAFDLDNTIFEYAICKECAVKMMASLSRDSLVKIHDHFEQYADIGQRLTDNLNTDKEPDLDALIGRCLLKGLFHRLLYRFWFILMITSKRQSWLKSQVLYLCW